MKHVVPVGVLVDKAVRVTAVVRMKDVAEQIDQYRHVGVTTLAGLVVTASSATEMNDAMVEFMTEVASAIGN